VLECALALAVGYGCALSVFPLLRRPIVRGPVEAVAVFVLVGPLLMIAADHVIARALVAVFTTDVFFKLVDVSRHQRHGGAIQFRDYVIFLIPFPVLLVVYADKLDARRTVALDRWDALRILVGSVLAAAAFLLVLWAADSAFLRANFPVDHVLTVLLFLVFIESAAQCLCGVERLTGFATTPITHFAFVSRTPAEFWGQRYNTRVHRWLYRNVFVPSGGWRAPVLAVCLVMVVSAVLHELMFDLATSRIDGYQLTFFLVQTPAILASGALERLARSGGIAGQLLAHGVTVCWMVATSVFFFHGVARIFPFVYASESWLP
jgi:hypothetical protein